MSLKHPKYKIIMENQNTPPRNGSNLRPGFMSQAEEWIKEHPEEYAQGYRPHFGKDGSMTIKHPSEFSGVFKPL